MTKENLVLCERCFKGITECCYEMNMGLCDACASDVYEKRKDSCKVCKLR